MSTNAVAVVGTSVITRDAFQELWNRRTQPLRATNADWIEKQAVLDELIGSEVLYQKALEAGCDKDPQIAASLRRMIIAKYHEDQLAKLGRPNISPDEIAEYYRANPQRFGAPAKVRAALIEFKVPRTATPEKRSEVSQRAESVLAEAKSAGSSDGTFGLVAQRHSEDQASRYVGGDIGCLIVGDTNGPWHPAVLGAISKLKEPGEIAPVVETPSAFYLVKLVELQPASMRPLEEVKDGVEFLAAREKEQEQEKALYAHLKHGMRIQTNNSLLESLRLPVRERPLPPVPGTLSSKTRTP